MPLAKSDVKNVEIGLSTLQLNFAENEIRETGFEDLLDSGQVLEHTLKHIAAAEQYGIELFCVNALFSRSLAHQTLPELFRQAAQMTERIKLMATGPNLVCDRPKVIFQQFEALERDYPGRMELSLNRDSFGIGMGMLYPTEVEANAAFNERLDIWSELLAASASKPKVWIDVEVQSEAVLQAARHQIPLQLQSKWGNPLEFQPLADLYYQAISRFGDRNLPLSVQVLGLVGEDQATIEEVAFEVWRHRMPKSTPLVEARTEFDRQMRCGGLFVGNPVNVAKQLAQVVEHFGLHRIVMRYPCGLACDHYNMEHVRLFGTEVIPLVREFLTD
ncbi:hypothetical protein QVA66_10360 [Staphylococcus chromogenes]|nr:hypothetical protein [Staphylococcus chromogenes]